MCQSACSPCWLFYCFSSSNYTCVCFLLNCWRLLLARVPSSDTLVSLLRKASVGRFVPFPRPVPSQDSLASQTFVRTGVFNRPLFKNLINWFKTRQYTASPGMRVAKVSCCCSPILSPFLKHLSDMSPSFHYVPPVRYCEHVFMNTVHIILQCNEKLIKL